MDSGEFNKIAGGVIGALLVFMLLNFFAEQTFHGGGGHHGEEVLAYALPIEEAGEEVAEEEEAIDYAALIAAADPARGEKIFNQCKACHKVENGANAVGPHLYGVVGRDIAAVDGFGYSGALAEKEGVWDYDTLMAFLENPKGWAPGTKMGYNGLKDAEDRTNLIAWLNTHSDSPVELKTELAAAGEAETEVAAAPVEEAPAEAAAPAEEAPAEAAAPAEEAPAVAAAPAEEAPAEAAAPAEEAPAVAAAPAEEAPAEAAAPAEEAPAEPAAPAEAAAPAEEAPAVAAAPAEAPAEAAAGGAYAELIAKADAAAGKKVYNKCKACHVADKEQNRVGPHLVGVIGREIASVEGFNYSDAMKNHGGAWTLDNLMPWLENPKEFAPGNKMSFAGLKGEQDRINLLQYLAETSGGSLK